MSIMRDDDMQGMKLAKYIFECTMSVLYILFSILLLFTNIFAGSLENKTRIILGLVLGIYGIFRVYRALKKLFIKDR